MPDMLVKLYDLPDKEVHIKEMRDRGIIIRRALPPEKHVVLEWVKENFKMHWVSECDVAFSNKPVSCYIAVKDKEILGFACYDVTCKDFFGPTGVKEEVRGQGIGSALLLASLEAMREVGYAYAIIGGAGPIDFYKKACNAVIIEDSVPGIYRGML
jgi:GNAT superfamily N-acetyltransferase